MNFENIQEYINLGTALIAAVVAAIPTIIAIYQHLRAGELVVALHGTQKAIGEGGTLNDVVTRISALQNKVLETELQKSGAKVIPIEPGERE